VRRPRRAAGSACPEARINLAQAAIHLATAPKSNATVMAIDAALADVRKGATGTVRPHLRDAPLRGAKKLATPQGLPVSARCAEGMLTQQYPPTT